MHLHTCGYHVAALQDPESLRVWQDRVAGEGAVLRSVLLGGVETDVGECERWALMREGALGGPDAAYAGPAGSSHPSAQRPFEARRLPLWHPPASLPTREAMVAPRGPPTGAEQQYQHDFAVKMASARALLGAATEAMKG